MRKKDTKPSKLSDKRISGSTKLPLHDDWQEFLSLLISHKVKFLLIGGHALALFAAPRMTEDLDIFIERSPANIRRVRAVIAEFGFGDAAPDHSLLAEPYRVFMIGVKPFRIDILNTISGVSFAKAWKSRVRLQSAAGAMYAISKRDLIANKRAAGRPKDIADLTTLVKRKQ